MINKFKLFFILIPVLLSGCSLFSPVKVIPQKEYLIKATPTNVYSGKKSTSVLLVTTPQALQIYNTNKMAYITQTYQISYFANNRWADSPTQMLQPLIVDALQNTHHFRAVASAPFAGHYDIILNTDLLELQQCFMQQPSFVQIKLRAQLVQYSTNQVIATREFVVTRTAPEDTPYGGVIATNEAVRELLRELAVFAVNKA